MSIVSNSTMIFRRVIAPEQGTLPTDLAKFIQSLDFPAEDRQEFERLSEAAQEGALQSDDAELLDGYLHIDSLLSILRLKARRSLNCADR